MYFTQKLYMREGERVKKQEKESEKKKERVSICVREIKGGGGLEQ